MEARFAWFAVRCRKLIGRQTLTRRLEPINRPVVGNAARAVLVRKHALDFGADDLALARKSSTLPLKPTGRSFPFLARKMTRPRAGSPGACQVPDCRLALPLALLALGGRFLHLIVAVPEAFLCPTGERREDECKPLGEAAFFQ